MRGEALKDWEPQNDKEVIEYYREALLRLERIALNKNDQFSGQCLDMIAGNLRDILRDIPHIDFLRSEVIDRIKRISSQFPKWWECITALNKSLYYDAEEMDSDIRQLIKNTYFALIPNNPIDKLLFFSSEWPSEINNPDAPFDHDGNNDYNYFERIIKETVSDCPSKSYFFLPILNEWLNGDYHSSKIVVDVIAEHVDDPIVLVTALCKEVSSGREAGICSDFICKVIDGARKKNPSAGCELLDAALQEQALRAFLPKLIVSAGVDDDLIAQVVDYIKRDIIKPAQSVSLADEVLSDISPTFIDKLVSALLSKGCEGVWSAIKFLEHYMYRKLNMSDLEADMIKRTVLHPKLFEKQMYIYDKMDSYYWKDLIEKLFKYDYVDKKLAGVITSLIISMADMTDMQEPFDIFHFSDDARSILVGIIKLYPEVVWHQYHEKRTQVSREERRILNILFGNDEDNSFRPGILDKIPEKIIRPWLLKDKENRISEVLKWIRMLNGDKVNGKWSNKFISFIDKHVNNPSQLAPIYSRLVDGIRSGRYAGAGRFELALRQVKQLEERSSNSSVKKMGPKPYKALTKKKSRICSMKRPMNRLRIGNRYRYSLCMM